MTHNEFLYLCLVVGSFAVLAINMAIQTVRYRSLVRSSRVAR